MVPLLLGQFGNTRRNGAVTGRPVEQLQAVAPADERPVACLVAGQLAVPSGSIARGDQPVHTIGRGLLGSTADSPSIAQ